MLDSARDGALLGKDSNGVATFRALFPETSELGECLSSDAGQLPRKTKPHRNWRGGFRPADGCLVNGSARQSGHALLVRSLHCLAVPQILALVSTTIELNRSTGTP
jgi:hypothetical protein